MGVLRTLMIGAGALLALPGAAGAHIVADPGRAEAGAYQAVVFRPQPKPGWRLEIERREGRVAAVTWRGELPADQFDAFALLFKLPDQAATLYFPTVQSCGAEQSQWTEIPSAGERASHPAPALVVTPKAAAAEPHQH